MSQQCPRCDRGITTDTFVCTECVREARTDLTETADFVRGIDSKRARRGSRLWIGRGSTPAETPLPYDPRVSKAFDPVRNSLTTWARIHQAEHFDHAQPPRGYAGIALWLAEYVEWVAGQQWAPDAFNDYARNRESMKALFDSPPDREAIGECGAVHEATPDYPCTEILSAVKGELTHTCPKCATVHDVKARREKLLAQAEDFTVTVAEAVKLLRTSDRDITPRLVRAVIRYVPITSVGDHVSFDATGKRRHEAAYRLGSISDALALYESDNETKKGVRRVMRGACDTDRATLSASG